MDIQMCNGGKWYRPLIKNAVNIWDRAHNCNTKFEKFKEGTLKLLF